MKRFSVLIALMILLGVVLTACGGGGGGSDGGAPVNTGLSSGTFTKAIETGTATPWGAPFRTDPYDRDQHLVLASDIHGSGYITSLSLRSNATVTTAVTCPSLLVKMGNTTRTALTTTFSSNIEQGRGTFATVRNAAPYSVPKGAALDYFTINLDTPFYYNGMDNLVVEFTQTGGCSDFVMVSGDTRTNSTLQTGLTGTTQGTRNNIYLNMKLNFKGGDDAVEFSGALATTPAPFTTGFTARIQNLYLASDVAGAGPITGIGFPLGLVSSDGTYTYTLKLGHTTRTALTTTFADNFDAGPPVTVANSATFSLTGGMPAGTYFWITFPGTFTYNGKDNLLVDLDVTGAAGTNASNLANVGAGRSAVGDSGNAVANQGLRPLVFLAKFRFYGSTMDALTPSNSVDSLPFTAVGNPKIQSYYDPTMMGSSGTISKIAYRLRDDSVAGTYNNVAIVMGHTVMTSLTTTFADNMLDAKTVFSGTVMIPAGMKAGDWFEIPLTTAFAYDGKRSLVVETATDAGINYNALIAGTESDYTNRHLYSMDRTLLTGTLQPLVFSQRFWYSK